MGLFDLPQIAEGSTLEGTVQNLFDAMFKLKKELEFILVNIDSSNIGSIDGASGVLAEPQKPRVKDVQVIISTSVKAGGGIEIDYDSLSGNTTVSLDIDDIDNPAEFVVEAGDIDSLTISSSYSQTEVQALRDKCELLATDCRSLRDTVDGLVSKLSNNN